jgi:hypothetical protein
MSNALALAATSAVLTSLLHEFFTIQEIQLGSVMISAKAPDLIPTDQTTSSPLQVNLFLHQVTPNAAWRNVQLPSLATDGSTRLRNQPLALDLHYLLTAYGTNDFEAEALLGYAVQFLHETPIVARDDIRAMLTPSSGTPPAVGTVNLNLAGLADQLEMLKITPETLGREEMAWIWTALKADYRPSFSFQVTVVLIQAENTGVSALPVLRRHIRVRPDVTSPLPALTAVSPPTSQPSAKPGDVVTVSGVNLNGLSNVVLSNARLGINQTIMAAAAGGSFQFMLPNPAPLPNPPPPPNPQDIPAGVYLLSAQVKTGADVVTTNTLPFAAAPTITTPPASPVTRDTQGNASVTITCAPYLRPGQEALLLIGAQSGTLTTAITNPSNSLSFEFKPLLPSSTPQLVRLRIDGVESQIIDMTKNPPVFSGPTVIVT